MLSLKNLGWSQILFKDKEIIIFFKFIYNNYYYYYLQVRVSCPWERVRETKEKLKRYEKFCTKVWRKKKERKCVHRNVIRLIKSFNLWHPFLIMLFIIRSRHQSVFYVGGNWIPDLLFNHQRLLLVELIKTHKFISILT